MSRSFPARGGEGQFTGATATLRGMNEKKEGTPTSGLSACQTEQGLNLSSQLPTGSQESVRSGQPTRLCEAALGTRFLCPWIFQVRILEWVAISSSKGSS